MERLHILVAYASGHGSTAGVAGEIADAVRVEGATVDAVNIDDAPDPSSYDAIVIGSPIRYDTWLPGAKAYVLAHEAALSARPVAFFLTCMALSIPGGNVQGRTYGDTVATQCASVKPVSVGQFAGALDYRNFPLLLRLPARLLFTFLGAKSGDYRDFDTIRDWSRHCFEAFQSKNEDYKP